MEMGREDFVLGQPDVVAFIDRIIKSDNAHHALLFSGRRGTGRLTMARYYAMGLNCREIVRPCLDCLQCRRILEGNHPDMQVFQRDRETVFSIDAMREVIRKSYMFPFEAKMKVFVLFPEFFNEESANAFLKTLEEPTPSTRFVLIAENSDQMMETILSRCMILRFRPLSGEVLRQILERETKFSEREILSVIPDSWGSVKIARFLLETGFSELMDEWERVFFKGDNRELYEFLATRVTTFAGSCLKKNSGTDSSGFGLEKENEVYTFMVDAFFNRATRVLYNSSLQMKPVRLKGAGFLETILELRQGLQRGLRPELIFLPQIMKLSGMVRLA